MSSRSADARWVPRTFGASDAEAILELRKLVFHEPSYTRERWNWQYLSNPQGKGLVDLAIDQDDPKNLAGHYAVIPYQIQIGGAVHRSAQSLDTFTHPDFRNQGIFVGLAERTFEKAKGEGVEFVFGFPNSQSFPGFVGKLGFTHPFGLSTYQRPLSLHFFLKRIGLGALRSISRKLTLLKKPKPGWRFLPANEPPGDDLLRDFEKWFPIQIKRGREYLRWRYWNCPDRKYSCFELRDPAGKQSGFAVLRFNQDQSVGYLIDYLAKDVSSFRNLLAFSLSEIRARELDSAIAYMQEQHRLLPLFRRAGFIKRGAEVRFILRKLGGQTYQPPLEKPENWHLCAGDTDFF